jgi:ABC-type spermidine/putrescine transport system permease subunit I
MIGNIIQFKYLNANDFPSASALGFVLLVGVTVLIAIYTRVVGTERLTT